MQKDLLCNNTKTMELSEILGNPKTRKEVVAEIEKDELSCLYFKNLPVVLQEELIAFCMGNRGLKITYDPFFKFIFNPSLHPERLSELLSLVFGEEVEVVDAIPNESDRVTEDGSLLITDILVRLRDGSYANVEIQKIGYAFPGQRCACYSADLLIRQLARAKMMAKKKKQKFSYGDLKKVYTIVLIEESTALYWKHSNEYIHRGKQTFDTGLELDLLQEFILIPLDIFKNMPHNTISKLEAWLYFIGSDEPKDIFRVVEAYPQFKEFYKELIGLRYDMKGLTSMFDYYRQLLREADQGTVQYMIEEQKKELDEIKQEIADKNQEIASKSKELADKKQELADKNQEIASKSKELADKNQELADKNQEIEGKNQELADKNQEIEDKDKQLVEERKRVAELEMKLAELMSK